MRRDLRRRLMARRRANHLSLRRAALFGAAAGAVAAGTVAVGAVPAYASGDSNCVDESWLQSEACNHVLPYRQTAVVSVSPNTAMNVATADVTNDNAYLAEGIDAYGVAPVCGPGTLAYLEIGYVYGFFGPRYSFYDKYVLADHETEISPYATTTADGSSHTYEITGNGGYWSASIDSQAVLAFGPGEISTNICEGMAGMEASQADFNKSTTSAATNNATDLKWQDTNGNWHTGWTTSQTWIDHPCNHGYLPPNCFNGLYNGAATWSANKPAQ